MTSRVVVTGLGVVAPNGVGKEEFNESIKLGKSGIKSIQELITLGLSCHLGGIPEIKGEYNSIPRKLVNTIEASNLIYGIMAGLEAWEDAGLQTNNDVDWSSGVIMGLQMSDGRIVKTIFDKINTNNLRKLSARTAEQAITSSLSAYLSGLLGLGNCAISNSSACSTGTEAVLLGYNRIRSGEAKRILVGSSESNSPLIWVALDHINALNTDSNDKPTEASKPLSNNAKGFIPACGAGALVLESLDCALERNAVIYAEISGGASNCGGQRNGGTMTKPNPEGIKRCIEKAIDSAKIDPSEIDLISGHLTGTFADPLEVKVWSEALKVDAKDFPNINSLKSMTGHCLAAAGSIECVAAVLQLYNSFIHPTINCTDIHAEILKYLDPNKISLNYIHKEIQYVIKGSFGFGDLNSCLIFKRYDDGNKL